MVIDTSATNAILLGKPDASRTAKAMTEDPIPLINRFSMLEAEFQVEANREGKIGESRLYVFIAIL